MTERDIATACDALARAAGQRTLTLPWHFVQHDNHRLMPSRGRLMTSPVYRAAKESARLSLKKQWAPAPMLVGDVVLVARAFFPDRRKRDAGNYRKLITDALSGIAYADDAQCVDERWVKAGIDKENPRIELEVTACQSPTR